MRYCAVLINNYLAPTRIEVRYIAYRLSIPLLSMIIYRMSLKYSLA